MWEANLYTYCMMRLRCKWIAISTVIISVINFACSNVHKEDLLLNEMQKSVNYLIDRKAAHLYNMAVLTLWGLQFVTAIVLLACIFHGNIRLAFPMLICMFLKSEFACILIFLGTMLVEYNLTIFLPNLIVCMGNLILFGIDFYTYWKVGSNFLRITEYT